MMIGVARLGLARKLGTRAISWVAARVFLVNWKEYCELRYWRHRERDEGALGSQHFGRFFTQHFGLDASF